MGNKDKSKSDYVDCPKAGHYKHLIICAIGCPFKGGNKKCHVFKREMTDRPGRIQDLVDQYNEKYGPDSETEEEEPKAEKEVETVVKKAKAKKAKSEEKPKPPVKPKALKKKESKPKAKIKKQPKKKKEAKPTPLTPKFVFVDSTGVVTLLETFDPSADTLPLGRVFQLGAEVKRTKDAKTGEKKQRRQKRAGPKTSTEPAPSKRRKSRRKADAVEEKKPAFKIRVPKRLKQTAAKKEKK